MTAVMKTLSPARPSVKPFLSTNIPFLDRSNPDAFSSCYHEDYQPFSFKKLKPVCQPTPAEVVCKDLRYVKVPLTETMESYHHHPLPKITPTARWPMLHSNVKMQTDQKEKDAWLTTESQQFCPKPFSLPSSLIRPVQGIKIIQVEKTPESISKATFTPHYCSPVAKTTAKHLEEGFPTIKGDKRCCSFISQYNNTFQGVWSRAAQPVDKHSSSVAMGDPEKIADRKTTYSTSFSRPTVCRPPVVKQHLKLNLAHFTKDSWTSTSREAFCCHKPDPVVLTKKYQNFSSLPKGDTNVKSNKERMSVTTNRVSFSDLKHEHPVFVPGPQLMTKSHVQFSSPRLSEVYYTTTAKEHYSKKDGEQARPAVQLPSNILSGPEHGLSLSTTKVDYLPLKTCRQTPCLSQQSNIKFPLGEQQFSTTHSDVYKAWPL